MPTDRYSRCLTILLLMVSACASASARKNPFFAFDNGTGRDQKIPLDRQAEMVKRAGYDGLGFTGAQRIPEVLQALDARGLKLFSIYVSCQIDQPGCDPNLPEAIRQLKGRDTALWLTVRGSAPDGDSKAAALVRDLAGLAAESGLRVVLYPHVGFYVERIQDALRIRKLAGRPNVGVSFNLAHFLAIGDGPKLDSILAESLPWLEIVSINGADPEGNWRSGDWSQLIQPLDSGTYDVRSLVRKLVSMGYKGPFGLQGYQVKGDIETNLRRSMTAWRTF